MPELDAVLDRARGDLIYNFPQLDLQSIELLGEGIGSRALLVNGDLIFRFPKYQRVAEALNVEMALLPKLRQHVELSIPNFEYIGQQSANRFPFVGYRKIRGVTLEDGLMTSFDGSVQRKLMRQLLEFARQVHAFPLDTAKQCGVRTGDFKAFFADELERLRKDAYRFLDQEVIDYVEQLHRAHLSDERNFGYAPALLHADLGPEHIFYDDIRQALVGVIDFGNLVIGDPDYEFRFLYRDYGMAFAQEIPHHYPHNDLERLMKKLDFFSRCSTVHYLLIGVDRKDDSILKEAVQQLQEEAKT